MDGNAPWSLTLDGAWRLSGGPEQPGPHHPDHLPGRGWRTIPATVPGCAELALVAAGLEPDPAVGDAVWRFRAYEGHEWWWEREFTVGSLPGGVRIELVCEALDGLATLWLDGVEIGRAENGLIAHRFDVTAQLAPGAHRLVVRFASTVNAGRAVAGGPGDFHVENWESLPLRLAGHQFGWDIMPRLIGTGIPRGVRLEAVAPRRVRSVYWATLRADPAARSARLLCDWELDLPAGEDGWRVRASLVRGGEVRLLADRAAMCHRGRVTADLSGIALWWPRGWGEAARYDAIIELVAPDGRVADRHVSRIGIRHVVLVRTKTDFAFVVNGERIWARGTNWVPLDALHARDAQHRDAALAMVADLDCTMLRMWGGNRYEDDAVYDWCDANGVLVWQDFGLACGIYPQDDAFAAALAIEAAAVIRRLRNHPCLAVWCGGNETDEAHQWPGLGLDPRQDRPSRQVLPLAVRTHDPVRSYLPSSPCLDDDPPPEVHLWGPRDDWVSPYYATHGGRAAFVSEIGFHGCPAEPSLAAMQPAGAALWPLTDPRWRPQAVCASPDPAHPHGYRLALVERQATLLSRAAPTGLPAFVVASQLVQAEAMKTLFERFRIAKGRTWGMLWWNLRDGWPVISDAVVDYFGRRKLAYATLRRSQAQVLAAVAEAADGRHRVMLVNDGLQPVAGVLRISDDAGAGAMLAEQRVAAGGNAPAVEVGSLPVAGAAGCWRIDLRLDDGRHFVNHALVGERPYRPADLARWYAALGLAADGVELG